MVRALCSQARSFLPPEQKRNTPRNFGMKRLSEHSKRSEKECDEKEFAQGTKPMLPSMSLFTHRTQKGCLQELRHETPHP